MRPVLKPALSRVWHDERTLQLGRGPATSHRYRVTAAARAVIDALDGTRDIDALLCYAERIGVARGDTLDLLDRLAADGCLDDAALDTRALAALAPGERARLDPDLSGLGLRHRLPGGAVRALERRRGFSVAVHGLGRVGTQTALRLAAAGIGTIVPVDGAAVRHEDTGPGAYRDEDVGARRQDAVARAIRLLAPSVNTVLTPRRTAADLTIIAPGERPPTELLVDLTRRLVPHLLVEVCEDRAVLGPLVVPRRTPCVRCRDLALTDRDPLWPRTQAGLAADGATTRPACDTTLAALAANFAVLHALAYLDGQTPPSVGAVWSFALPYALPERFPVPEHPACGCVEADRDDDDLRLFEAAAPPLSTIGLAEWTM
jgi:bacteriocin biosynthesis cyclodehydratase domain-containing protein